MDWVLSLRVRHGSLIVSLNCLQQQSVMPRKAMNQLLAQCFFDALTNLDDCLSAVAQAAMALDVGPSTW